MVAFFLDFDGMMYRDPWEGASVAFYGWHAMDTSHAWPERAETGQIGRSPTISVGAHGLSAAMEKGGGTMEREPLSPWFEYVVCKPKK